MICSPCAEYADTKGATSAHCKSDGDGCSCQCRAEESYECIDRTQVPEKED